MLIDKTYFIGEINIAGLGTQPTQDALNLFIGKREPVYLELALGYAFNKLFQASIAAVSGRWFDLRTGAEYVNCKGITKKWKGFTNTEKQSPIANYTYFYYQRDNTTFTATVGEMEGKSENATAVSPGPKQRNAWNEMADQTKTLHDYLLNKKDDAGALIYPEFSHNEVKCIELLKKLNFLNL